MPSFVSIASPNRNTREDALKLDRHTGVLFAIAAVTLGVDQFTKYLVITRLAPLGVWTPLPSLAHILTFTYTTNTGVAFGLLKAWGPVFIGVAVVVIAAIAIYQRDVPAGAWLVRLALGLQLGGAAGNLVDRLRLGHVVDFIHLHYYTSQIKLDWPVFNVADSSIVVGVILLAFTMLREGRESAKPAPHLGELPDSHPSESV
jgi:signal peptidase II